MSKMTSSQVAPIWSGSNRLNRHLKERICVELHISIQFAADGFHSLPSRVQDQLLYFFNTQYRKAPEIDPLIQGELFTIEPINKSTESVFNDGFHGAKSGHIN